MSLTKAIPELLLLMAAVSSAAAASESLQGEIRFRAADQELLWVGQQQELYLELWTEGFSFADQLFVLPEVTGAFLLQPDSSTVKLTEDRDGEAWQGLRYTLLLYPQRDGTLQVPSFDVSFTARAGFGSEPARFRYSTPLLEIETRMPPGVGPGGLLVTTTAFSMVSEWTPMAEPGETVELEVGDAITLNVTRRAQDVPGMVFGPLPELVIEGLGVYPASPEVNDQVNRGTLTGERTDSVTFICEREGTYRLPEIRFQWWDPRREQLAEKSIGALELAVSTNPAWKTAPSSSAAKGGARLFGWRYMLLAAGVLLLMILAWLRGLPRIREYLQQKRERVESGESWAFQKALRACESGKPAEAYRAIALWLGRVASLRPGTTLMELADLTGNAELKKEATALQERVASGLTEEWRGGRLAKLLVLSREGMDQPSEASHVLQHLNPPLKRGSG